MRINNISSINFNSNLNRTTKTNNANSTPYNNNKETQVSFKSYLGEIDILLSKKQKMKESAERLLIDGKALQNKAKKDYDAYSQKANDIIQRIHETLQKTSEFLEQGDSFKTYKEYKNGEIIRETKFSVTDDNIQLKYIKENNEDGTTNVISFNNNKISMISHFVQKHDNFSTIQEEFIYNNGQLNSISTDVVITPGVVEQDGKTFFFEDEKISEVHELSSYYPDGCYTIAKEYNYKDEQIKVAKEGVKYFSSEEEAIDAYYTEGYPLETSARYVYVF